jgi:hypothetical protein
VFDAAFGHGLETAELAIEPVEGTEEGENASTGSDGPTRCIREGLLGEGKRLFSVPFLPERQDPMNLCRAEMEMRGFGQMLQGVPGVARCHSMLAAGMA